MPLPLSGLTDGVGLGLGDGDDDINDEVSDDSDNDIELDDDDGIRYAPGNEKSKAADDIAAAAADDNNDPVDDDEEKGKEALVDGEALKRVCEPFPGSGNDEHDNDDGGEHNKR